MSTWGEESPVLQSHTEESHKAAGQARKQLVSKKVQSGKQSEKIPKEQKEGTLARDINAPTVTSIVDIDVGDLQRKDAVQIGDGGSTKTAAEEDEEVEDVEGASDDEFEASGDAKESDAHGKSGPSTRHTRKKRPGSSKRPLSSHLEAILPNTENELSERLRRQQTAISRRVFMDREREAVRENIRRQQHKKKIASLKREKEEVRQQLEMLARQQLASAASPGVVIEESLEEARVREDLEELCLSQEADRRRDEIRRLREMERYLDALRHRLMERVKRQGQQLPALCACAETIWDTHPETCANNCFFYRNHRAYARALQSLLVSVETM